MVLFDLWKLNFFLYFKLVCDNLYLFVFFLVVSVYWLGMIYFLKLIS